MNGKQSKRGWSILNLMLVVMAIGLLAMDVMGQQTQSLQYSDGAGGGTNRNWTFAGIAVSNNLATGGACSYVVVPPQAYAQPVVTYLDAISDAAFGGAWNSQLTNGVFRWWSVSNSYPTLGTTVLTNVLAFPNYDNTLTLVSNLSTVIFQDLTTLSWQRLVVSNSTTSNVVFGANLKAIPNAGRLYLLQQAGAFPVCGPTNAAALFGNPNRVVMAPGGVVAGVPGLPWLLEVTGNTNPILNTVTVEFRDWVRRW